MVRDHARLDDHDARISFPVHDGRRGNPVLWGCRFFDALKALHGDIGGREILAKHAGAVNSITWRDDSIHRDIDSKDDIAV
jgi:molybdenum cofactor cytidylyltransferase